MTKAEAVDVAYRLTHPDDRRRRFLGKCKRIGIRREGRGWIVVTSSPDVVICPVKFATPDSSLTRAAIAEAVNATWPAKKRRAVGLLNEIAEAELGTEGD